MRVVVPTPACYPPYNATRRVDCCRLARVVFSERELTFTFAICYRPSVCRLSVCLSVCRLSVTLVRLTQAVEIFRNISTALGTLAIR